MVYGMVWSCRMGSPQLVKVAAGPELDSKMEWFGAFMWWKCLPSWSPVVSILMKMMNGFVQLRWQTDDLVKDDI